MNQDIDRSRSLLEAARAAAGAQQYPRGVLYVVATPIGNLADLSLRAIHVLSLVDAVACEDTRVAGSLLAHLGLHKPLVAAHEHNEREAADAIVERLKRDERVALVSDAGTPAVSDPGARLVAAVTATGLRVVPVPGASAVIAALSAAGAVSLDGGFRFAGFLPAKGAARRERLAELWRDPTTVVLYESPHRIEALADELAAHACKDAVERDAIDHNATAGDPGAAEPPRPAARAVTIARELTKQFEALATMPASEVPLWLAADAQRRRGEFVVVLHPRPPTPVAEELDATARRVLAVLLRELPLKQAVTLTAEATGAARNALYDAALSARKGDAVGTAGFADGDAADDTAGPTASRPAD